MFPCCWPRRRALILQRRKVQLDADELFYDYLIVAAGATHAYFGHPEWATYAPGLKSVEDATEIRRRMLLAFEIAERRARLNHASTNALTLLWSGEAQPELS